MPTLRMRHPEPNWTYANVRGWHGTLSTLVAWRMNPGGTWNLRVGVAAKRAGLEPKKLGIKQMAALVKEFQDPGRQVENEHCPVCANKMHKPLAQRIEDNLGQLVHFAEACYQCGLYWYQFDKGVVKVCRGFVEATLDYTQDDWDEKYGPFCEKVLNAQEEAKIIWNDERTHPFILMIRSDRIDRAPCGVFADWLDYEGGSKCPLQAEVLRRGN